MNWIKKLSLLIIVILLSNQLYSQGPNASESMSFEPVDATDMVNLVTGDFTYVLPLLNVPSPEGGYPIALSYHAGIAMDQEASWVGLGWNINPGAITRNINGYPDDWDSTGVNEFFYDKGWEEDYYSISAGVTLYGTYSVGLGASWGGGKGLGGYVSLGVGIGSNMSVGFRLGTDGGSIYGGINDYYASVGTNGVGIGYGYTPKGGDTTFGVSLNYSYNNGLSGGISVSQDHGAYSKGIAKGGRITSGMGISFSSKGVSMNAKAKGYGAGISTSNYSISGGDYDVVVSSSSFTIPFYVFYVAYSHTKVSFSLFKNINIQTSGFLYPIVTNSNSYDGEALLDYDTSMDVNVLQKFDRTTIYNSLLNSENSINQPNLVLPNYDNYNVSAQGLLGTISPYTYSEFNLSSRGKTKYVEEDGEMVKKNYLNYIGYSYDDYIEAPEPCWWLNKDALKKISFTLNNSYSSFSRHETTDINSTLPTGTAISSTEVLGHFTTDDFTDNYNPLAYKRYNFPTMTYKKMEGNVIETYTNEEIRGGVSGFIEAKNIDRADTDTFLDKGIGAYKITTSDGKTYHYSLPVYQFESFYRSFKEEWDEDGNIFEVSRTKPYATHWLLTAITGPDYIDFNPIGQVDSEDYGYWVEFDYGKWSDGYVWQTPNGRLEEINDIDHPDDPEKITYAYSWGRKQVYYLDAIKTRTHTALFIKDLRSDAKSEEKDVYEGSPWNHQGYLPFDKYRTHTKKDNSKAKAGILFPQDFYRSDGTILHLPFNFLFQFKFSNATYYENDKEYLLCLKSILLIDNAQSINYDKTNGNLLTNNIGYHSSHFLLKDCYDIMDGNYFRPENRTLAFLPSTVNQFNQHLHQNILDVSDIEGLGLESQALQVIEFDYDYTLAKGTPNSDAADAGRLTLNSVQFKGKQGIEVTPPYQFTYNNTGTIFDKNYIDDWGYYKNDPDVWSLNTITTPIGQEIKMEYEPDSYYAEVVCSEEFEFDNISVELFPVNYNSYMLSWIKVTSLDSSFDFTKYFKPGTSMTFKFHHTWKDFFSPYDIINEVDFEHKMIVSSGSIYPNEMVLYLDSPSPLVNEDVGVYSIMSIFEGDIFSRNTPLCRQSSSGLHTICLSNPRVISNYNDVLLTETDDNGREGGGLRTTSVTVSDGIKNIARTEYEYKDQITNKTTGITSYAPSKTPKGIPYVSELPPPTVMYANVKMINKDEKDDITGSIAYEFETLEPRIEESGYLFSLGDAFKVKEQQDESFNNGKVKANKFTIYNNLGILGRLKSVSSYNSEGQILLNKVNNYKQDLDANGEIGVTQESHKSLKRVKEENGDKMYYVSSTSKVNYPSVLSSITESHGGLTSTTYFDKHDFLTGQLLETRTFASDGTAFKTKTVPAYTIDAYNLSSGYGMGSKVDDITNKNMLTQQAASYTYLWDKDMQDWKTMNASINTWNNEWAYFDLNPTTTTPETDPAKKVWRKHKNYVWQGDIDEDGAYQNYADFNWGTSTQVPAWKNVSTVTHYDHYSAALQVKDINNNYACTKYGDNDSKIFATGNAKYANLYYSGAEDIFNGHWFSGGVRMKSTGCTRDSSQWHTGKFSVKATQGNEAFAVNVADGGKYKVSVWVHKDNCQNIVAYCSTTGNHQPRESETVIAGDWVQLNFYVKDVSQGAYIYVNSTNGTAWFDDFRVQPVASSMTSYVYNEWDELSYTLGANNMATQYIYDSAGKLCKVYKEVEDTDEFTGGFIPIKDFKYHYNGGVDVNCD